MKIFDCEQGSPDWFQAKLGVPSSSNFDKIITPGGKPSTQAETYMHTLLAELMTGQPQGMEPTEWMQRGKEGEAEARTWYEFARGVDVKQVGFVLAGSGAGCSPDGLVGDDGMLEIKVPKPSTHVEYLLNGNLPMKYKPQVQGQLWVCERKFVDFVSYAPNMPPVVARVGRDEGFIETLAGLMGKFMEKFAAKRERLIELGHMGKAA